MEYEFKTEPFDWQKEYLDGHCFREYSALLAEMGTGKTWAIINNFSILWREKLCDCVLVIATNGVQRNWVIKEIPEHAPPYLEHTCAAWSSKQKKEDKRQLAEISKTSEKLRILTMNYESLHTKKGFDFAFDFCESAKKLMIVCDESDAVKNPRAARTKALMKLKKLSSYRRIMTGTPICNAPFDCFSQMSFLHDDILKTKSFYAFKSEYAIFETHGVAASIAARTGYAPQIVAKDAQGRHKYKNLEQLSDLIKPHSFRVLKKDCLDLPEKLYQKIEFDLTTEQKKSYKQMRDELSMSFEGEVSVVHRLASLGKLSQIASGFFYTESGICEIAGGSPKIDILEYILEKIHSQGCQAIVWARFKHELDQISKLLNCMMISFVRYDGDTSKEDRTSAIQDFEASKASVFLASQQAAGAGITLVAASYAIYYSNDFSLRNRLQSEDRCHRAGQKKAVTYIDIVAKDTIDEKILQALRDKKEIADIVVDRNFL